MKHLRIRILLAFLAGISISAKAEFSTNPFQPTDTVIGSGQGSGSSGVTDQQLANPLVQSTAGSLMGSASDVSDTSNADDGRRMKAQDAANQAEKGAEKAAGTGAAMIGTGTAMIASGLPPLIAAGSTLVAMGAMELAQSGADKKAQQANQNQVGLLTQNEANKDPAKMNTPGVSLPKEAQDFLNSRGINPDQYMDAAANGDLLDPEAALRAIGEDPSNFSAEDMASGQEQAMNYFNNTAAQAHRMDPSLLGFDEKSQSKSSSNQNPQQGGSATLATGGFGSDGFGRGIGAEQASASGSSSTEVSRMSGDIAGAGNDASEKNPFGMANPFLSKMAEQVSNPLVREHLETLGVKVPRKGQNIFHIARQKYSSFAGWRRSLSRVAELFTR